MSQPEPRLLEWDTAHFGKRVGSVWPGRADEVGPALAWARREGVELLVARCDAHRHDVVAALQEGGARLATSFVQMRRAVSDAPSSSARSVREDEVELVAGIAARAFAAFQGHFHRATDLDPAKASAVYVELARNSCREKRLADDVLVVEERGEVGGFATLKQRSSGSAEAVLVGIDPRFQKRGLVRSLLAGALRWCRERGLSELTVDSQLDNAPAIRAWERAGFALANAGHTFHVRFPKTSGDFGDDDARTVARFSKLVAEHGRSVRSVDWGSAASQAKRFAVLASIGSLEGARVLDVGCGLGDFLDWLEAQKIACDYSGIDLTPAMVDAARATHRRGSFRNASCLDLAGEPERSFDWVFASGIFYLRKSEPLAFLREATRAMFRVARLGIAFNCLSTWATRHEPDEFHADPGEVLEVARELSPRVSLRHDYHPNDFTVFVHRDP